MTKLLMSCLWLDTPCLQPNEKLNTIVPSQKVHPPISIVLASFSLAVLFFLYVEEIVVELSIITGKFDGGRDTSFA